eukprot:358499-Chlamydomonas_euryale.AAC.6
MWGRCELAWRTNSKEVPAPEAWIGAEGGDGRRCLRREHAEGLEGAPVALQAGEGLTTMPKRGLGRGEEEGGGTRHHPRGIIISILVWNKKLTAALHEGGGTDGDSWSIVGQHRRAWNNWSQLSQRTAPLPCWQCTLHGGGTSWWWVGSQACSFHAACWWVGSQACFGHAAWWRGGSQACSSHAAWWRGGSQACSNHTRCATLCFQRQGSHLLHPFPAPSRRETPAHPCCATTPTPTSPLTLLVPIHASPCRYHHNHHPPCLTHANPCRATTITSLLVPPTQIPAAPPQPPPSLSHANPCRATTTTSLL